MGLFWFVIFKTDISYLLFNALSETLDGWKHSVVGSASYWVWSNSWDFYFFFVADHDSETYDEHESETEEEDKENRGYISNYGESEDEYGSSDYSTGGQENSSATFTPGSREDPGYDSQSRNVSSERLRQSLDNRRSSGGLNIASRNYRSMANQENR